MGGRNSGRPTGATGPASRRHAYGGAKSRAPVADEGESPVQVAIVPAGTARQLQRALRARRRYQVRQSCRSARAASRGSAMSGQKRGRPREAELALRWCRTKGRKGQAPSGRADAPLVPHKGRKGASPERAGCRSVGAARRAAKGGEDPKGRAVAQPVPHKGQQRGASPAWQSCRSAGAAQRAERGKPRKGELSLSRCRTKGSKRGKTRKGELSLSRCCTKGSKRGKPRMAEPLLRREAEEAA